MKNGAAVIGKIENDERLAGRRGKQEMRKQSRTGKPEKLDVARENTNATWWTGSIELLTVVHATTIRRIISHPAVRRPRPHHQVVDTCHLRHLHRLLPNLPRLATHKVARVIPRVVLLPNVRAIMDSQAHHAVRTRVQDTLHEDRTKVDGLRATTEAEYGIGQSKINFDHCREEGAC